VEAFPDDKAPAYLLRDRDGIFGESFWRHVKRLGIEEVLTAPALIRRSTRNASAARHADPIEFIEALVAPLYLRLLLAGESLGDWPRNEMVDRLLAAYGTPRTALGKRYNAPR
jgi:hypothetical protein